eukprot:Hpha_TRINITY_DN14973_c1_g4::TRINITY_DN14973_c1_g4_i1::g.144664::m.144664
MPMDPAVSDLLNDAVRYAELHRWRRGHRLAPPAPAVLSNAAMGGVSMPFSRTPGDDWRSLLTPPLGASRPSSGALSVRQPLSGSCASGSSPASFRSFLPANNWAGYGSGSPTTVRTRTALYAARSEAVRSPTGDPSQWPQILEVRVRVKDGLGSCSPQSSPRRERAGSPALPTPTGEQAPARNPDPAGAPGEPEALTLLAAATAAAHPPASDSVVPPLLVTLAAIISVLTPPPRPPPVTPTASLPASPRKFPGPSSPPSPQKPQSPQFPPPSPAPAPDAPGEPLPPEVKAKGPVRSREATVEYTKKDGRQVLGMHLTDLMEVKEVDDEDSELNKFIGWRVTHIDGKQVEALTDLAAKPGTDEVTLRFEEYAGGPAWAKRQSKWFLRRGPFVNGCQCNCFEGSDGSSSDDDSSSDK